MFCNESSCVSSSHPVKCFARRELWLPSARLTTKPWRWDIAWISCSISSELACSTWTTTSSRGTSKRPKGMVWAGGLLRETVAEEMEGKHLAITVTTAGWQTESQSNGHCYLVLQSFLDHGFLWRGREKKNLIFLFQLFSSSCLVLKLYPPRRCSVAVRKQLGVWFPRTTKRSAGTPAELSWRQRHPAGLIKCQGLL